ncbi:MAG: TRAP transporter fused permease subunit [Deltaproteobacteria bacterium]|nr:TRAP transporter fused permease subunit [Deltaproteobacteria bacterium]
MFKRTLNVSVNAVGVAMVIYHLVYSQTYLQGVKEHQIFHLGFALILLFLMSMQKSDKRWPLKLAAVLLSTACFIFLRLSYERLELYGMYQASHFDLAAGAVLIVLCLEATRESFGPVLPALALLCIAYAFFGQYIPGKLHTLPMGWDVIIGNLSVGFSGTGIFGPILRVSAVFMFLFMLFAALVEVCGATEFFNQLGKFIARRFKAGPALAAVLTSGLMGSVTGQAGANVTITGSYTIPAMKAVGYKPYQAGAIEAAASTGGPIIPPVMGVAAFLITAMTGVSYGKIIVVAAVPALFYVFSCALYVQFQAAKMNIVPRAEEVNYRELILRSPLFFGSLLTIIILFVIGKTALYVSFWACFAITLISLIRKQTRPSLKNLMNGFVRGASLGSSIAVTCATLGIIVATITGTGLGIKLPVAIGNFCGQNVLLLLFMTAVVAIILGIGLPASASYLLVAIVLAPLLIRLGIALLPAHLFAFYFANFSYLTPPVAIAALFGAQLAGASYMRTGIEAAKVGIAGFVLPFMIIWSPAFLGDYSNPVVSVTGLLVCTFVLVGLQAGFVGYLLTNLKRIERICLFVGSLLLMGYLYTSNILWLIVGAGLLASDFIFQVLKKRGL